jgi:endonuclease-3
MADRPQAPRRRQPARGTPPVGASRASSTPRRLPVALRRQAVAIADRLDQQHPGATTELHYTNPFELLVATILSAQCTDARVNQVTPALFRRYPDAWAMAEARPEELEPQIQPTGFFRMKTRSLLGMARRLVERHGGQVPASMAALVELPGVGRKTANVVLGHALGVPGFPVDRHVLRVSNRLGVVRSLDPEIVEAHWCARLPPERWTRTSDALILHGRRVCRPTPLCDRCHVRGDCAYYKALGAKRRRAGGRDPAAR